MFSSAHVPAPEAIDKLIQRSRTEPTINADEMRDIIATCAAELEAYDVAISVAQETLTRLLSEREMMQRYSHVARSVLSPVRSLPAELLVKIFVLVRDGAEAQAAEDVIDRFFHAGDALANEPVMTLAGVCSQWRAVALGSPELWTTLYANITPFHNPHQVGLLTEALQRSAPLPLTVYLRSAYKDVDDTLQILLQQSPRWKTVFVSTVRDNFEVLQAISGNLPLLERLSFDGGLCVPNVEDEPARMSDGRRRKQKLEDFAAFLDAPRLVDVTFKDRAPKLPWGQLLAVTAQIFDAPSSLEEFWRSLAFLAECNMDCDVVIHLILQRIYATDTSLSTITSPIRSLALVIGPREATDSIRGPLKYLLDILVFPELTHLELLSRQRYAKLTLPSTSLSAWLGRSSLLTSLTLKGFLLDTHELFEDLLFHTGALTHLTLSDLTYYEGPRFAYRAILTDEFYTRPGMAEPDPEDGGWYLPELRELELDTFLRCTSAAVVQFLEGRMGLVRSEGWSGFKFKIMGEVWRGELDADEEEDERGRVAMLRKKVESLREAVNGLVDREEGTLVTKIEMA
uniref:F-box domain-containing protein n=1 Tax=Mycena chlorophos TaxID=658473 RepID=A0ABQ0L414_MYCCL|nr:predicted protein [Mycena chlorophos]